MSIFNEIIDEENIYAAYKQTRKGKNKFSIDAINFSNNETFNLKVLRESLINETYKFDGYTKFYVYEPKERLIYAPHYKDKIIQIAINNVLKKIYYPSFIYDSYSCIDGKGTHKCAGRIQQFLKRGKWEYNDPYILKIDIKKFFYSIDRDIFKQILKKKIKCNKSLRLIYKIIDSANEIDKLGLPLGNTLSQIGSNIYMNELDQYIKRELSIKYYCRYADDMFFVLKSKENAKLIMEKVKSFLKEKLKLNVNEHKTKIFPLEQGVNGIGFKIYPTHMLLRNDSKKRIKRKLKGIEHLIIEERMSPQKAEQMLNSWKGHADYACSFNFYNKLINKHEFLKLDENGIFRIEGGNIA